VPNQFWDQTSAHNAARYKPFNSLPRRDSHIRLCASAKNPPDLGLVGLVGVVWFGFVWFCLVLFGFVWFGWFNFGWFGLVLANFVWFLWFGMGWFGLVLFGLGWVGFGGIGNKNTRASCLLTN
jgi:hypothetical protein